MQSLLEKITFKSKGEEPETSLVPLSTTSLQKAKGAAGTEADRSRKNLLAPHKGQSLAIPCPWRIPESLLEPAASTKADMNPGCFTLVKVKPRTPTHQILQRGSEVANATFLTEQPCSPLERVHSRTNAVPWRVNRKQKAPKKPQTLQTFSKTARGSHPRAGKINLFSVH